MEIIYSVELILHILITIGIISGIILWSIWIKTHKYHSKYAISPLLFFCHALLFFALTFANVLNTAISQIWTDLLALHGVIILISGAIVMIQTIPEEK